MAVNRPQVVAHYTKDIVYARLAPGIVEGMVFWAASGLAGQGVFTGQSQ